MDFLTESLCGKDFLKLLARGSGIIAEILRLSNNIPKIFLNTEEEGAQFKDMLFEFEYLKNSEEFDEKIAKIPEYEQLEENLFDRYSVLIKRFMDLFESKFASDGRHHFVRKPTEQVDQRHRRRIRKLRGVVGSAAQHGHQQAGDAGVVLLYGSHAHLS